MQNNQTPSNACPTPSQAIVITSPSPEKPTTIPTEQPKKQQRQKNLNYKQELADIYKQLTANFNLRFSDDPDKPAPLVEHHSVVGGDPVQLSTQIDVKLEVQREAQFFNAALENSKVILMGLEELGVKLERPKDFYAEMFKSDAHMEKVAARLDWEKKRIENFETKKKQKQNVKFHKRLKHKRKVDAAKEKKEGLRQIEKWKQKIKKGDSEAELNFKQGKVKQTHGFMNQKNRKRGNKGKKRLGKSRRIAKKK